MWKVTDIVICAWVNAFNIENVGEYEYVSEFINVESQNNCGHYKICHFVPVPVHG